MKRKDGYYLFSLFQGMDIMKHGESAYPARAWVEKQYMEGVSLSKVKKGLAIRANEGTKVGLPPNMVFCKQPSTSDPSNIDKSLTPSIENKANRNENDENKTQQFVRRLSF